MAPLYPISVSDAIMRALGEEQPLSDIARYDWVILDDWASEFITPLKALNPDIMLLNSTNAGDC